MTTLLGIIFFHVLVIIGAKMGENDDLPVISTVVLTMLLTGYVVYMMFTMEKPEP